MFKTESKRFFTLMITLSIILTMLFCFSTIHLSDEVYAEIGNWQDYRAASLTLQNPLEENSVTNPYLISTAQELALIAYNVNNGQQYTDEYFLLTDDIDLASHYFTPIGTPSSAFSGTFNGDGYSIYYLTISSPEDDDVALFAYTNNAAIHNLAIENCNIVGANNVAALIANATASSIDNIEVSNSSISGDDYTGGIIGKSVGTSLYYSSVSQTDIIGNDYVGGLAGYMDEAELAVCVSSPSLQGNNYVGGLAGLMNGYVDESCFYGDISASDYVGGILGQGNAIIGSSFVFTQEIAGDDYVGGLVGQSNSFSMNQSYARTNITGNNYVGGIGGEVQTAEFYNSYFVGEVVFNTNGATIANITSSTLNHVYYNSDYINDESVTLNGVGLNSVELSQQSILGMDNQPMNGAYGYYPIIHAFGSTSIVNDSALCRYFEGGDGQNQPYKITSALQLQNMQRLIADYYADYGDKDYELVNDITLNGEFQPIASYDHPFEGNFNGKYYSIYNLYINKPNTDYVGLFSCIGEGSTVEKVNIRPLVISSEEIYGSVTGRDYVGAIAGNSEGFVWDCMNNTDISGNDYVGGLTGSADNISRSFNTGSIVGNNYVGGLTGVAAGIVQTGFNSGYIKANGNYSGGIAGRSAVMIELCYNSGNIESDLVFDEYVGNYKGGIVGTNDLGATVRNCYNLGGIKGVDVAFVAGGIVGDNSSNFVSNTYYNNEIVVGLNAIGQGNAGGANVLGLTTIQMVGTTALDEMQFPANNYVSNEERGMDADFSPQLLNYYNKSVLEGENTAVVDIIKDYSKQSVMLRLFGKAVDNLMDWGSEQNPYLISTFDHLDILSKQVNEGYSFVDCYFLVTEDVTILSGFVSIGYYDTIQPTNSKVFNGIFDGGGKTISNLVLGALDSIYSQGLFGYTGENSLIKNVIIGSGDIRSIEKAGSIVGYSLGEVTRCYSSAIVEAQTSIGGIVGQLKANTITHCLFDGDVIGSSNDWGGIVGRLENNASVEHCWYKLELTKEYSHKIGRESLIYDDRNGNVTVGVDMDAENIEDFIYFELHADSGFGFDVMNISHRSINFNSGGNQGNRYYPMYSTTYAGTNLIWYCRFTKPVVIAELENGSAYGDGDYFEGQQVTIIVSPEMGYRLVLDTETYSYIGDGETIDCTFIMGNELWDFDALFLPFGDETQIEKPGGGQTTFDDVFEYDGVAKVYNINIGEFNVYSEYYIVETSHKVEQAISANNYKLLIKLQAGNVIVGLKELFFSIEPKQLLLNESLLDSEEYTIKQYDKEYSDSVDIDSEIVIGVVSTDAITLRATRTYFDEFGNPDANVGENDTIKDIVFDNFTVIGLGANNYKVPLPVTNIVGRIIKRDVWIGIEDHHLTKQYDGNEPFIAVYDFDGELAGDGLFVRKFSFERDDDLPVENGDVGEYRLVDFDEYDIENYIGGNKENYNIMFKEAYVYTITPKSITEIIFNVPPNLQYNQQNQIGAITASYEIDPNTLGEAALTFYYNNEQTEECIYAGAYIAIASIPDQNFFLTNQQSISFTIAKINQSILELADISDTDYATTEIVLQAVGGDGEGAITYEVLSGPAVIQQNVLKINGTGNISVRAIKASSNNYNRQISNSVTFFVAKGTLIARIDDVEVSYGDEPTININYEGMLRAESKNDIAGLIEPDIYILETDLVVNEDGYNIYLYDNGSADGYIIDVSQVDAKLFVIKKRIHVVAVEATKIYGSEDPNLTYEVLEEGVEAQLEGSLKRASGENAGKYIINQNDLTSQNNPNYDITYIPRYFTIYPKELKVSIPIYTKTYGAIDPTPNFLIVDEDLQRGDNYSVLTGNITRDSGQNVGQYSYRYNNVSAGNNYTVRFISVGYLDIIKANPNFDTQPIASEIVYGETLASSVISGQTNVAGHFRWSNQAIMPSVHNSNITNYNAQFVPTDSDNYNVINFSLKVTVQKRMISIAFVGNTNMVFDGTVKARLSVKTYNVLEADADKNIVYIEYDTEYLINAGTYTATANVSDVNYEISGNRSVQIKIARSQLNISVLDAIITKGENYTPEIVYEGFIGGDNKSTLTKLAYVDAIPTEPGVYELEAQGCEAQNYVMNYYPGKLTINRTVLETSELIIEGILPPEATVSLRGLDNKSSSFGLMEKFTKNILLAYQYDGYTLNEYKNVVYSEELPEEMTFSVKMDLPLTDMPIIVHHKDGSVEMLTDYEYEDGYVTFTSSNVSGIGTIRENTIIEKYGIYALYVLIGILTALAVTLIVILHKKRMKRKARYTPKFKD